MPLNGFNNSISWSQFSQVQQRLNGQEDAFIRVVYRYTYQTGRNRNAVTVSEADVNIDILSSESWVVDTQMTDYLLRHEQGHYDITSLGARSFYNALLNETASSINALATSIRRLNTRHQQTINSANNRYDSQTQHSRDTNAQQRWNQAISAALLNVNGSVNSLPQ